MDEWRTNGTRVVGNALVLSIGKSRELGALRVTSGQRAQLVTGSSPLLHRRSHFYQDNFPAPPTSFYLQINFEVSR